MDDRHPQMTAFHALDDLPAGASMNSVTAESVNIRGRRALRVGLTEAAASGVPGVDYVDQPTFVLIPADFGNGNVEVDLLRRLADTAPDYARAFAGLAYRITENLEAAKVDPPGHRAQRAVQYFAYPEWNFERLREEYPDGRYESGAHIGPDEWIHLRIDVQDGRLRASVDGIQVLDLAKQRDGKPEAASGFF